MSHCDVRPIFGLRTGWLHRALGSMGFGAGEESQIFPGLESPGDVDFDFSGGGRGEAVAGVVLWAIRLMAQSGMV